MKTHISLFAPALASLLLLSGCAASDSGALSDLGENSSGLNESSSAEPAVIEQTSAEQTSAEQTTAEQTTTEQTTAVSDAPSVTEDRGFNG